MFMKGKNILFHAINGVGFWHINRAKNIAGSLKIHYPENNFYITSSTKIPFDLWPFSQLFPLTHGISKEDYQFYLHETEKELKNIIEKEAIDTLFHDTYYIPKIVRNLHYIDHIYVYRLSSLEHFQSVRKDFHLFRRIYIPHSREEFFSIIPEKELEGYSENIVFTDYIYTEVDLQESGQENTLLVWCGYGWDKDQVEEFLEYTLDILHSLHKDILKDFTIKIYPWKYMEDMRKIFSSYSNFSFCSFSEEDFRRDFQECSVFIGRGWYNTVGEVLSSSKKSLLFWAERVHESQNRRIEFYSNKNPFLQQGTYERKQDIKALKNLIQSDNITSNKNQRNGGDIISEDISSHLRQPLLVMYSSYIQDSHVFISDELDELSKYCRIYIITFNKNYASEVLFSPRYCILYSEAVSRLYLPWKFPFLSQYSLDEKKIYAYFLKYAVLALEKYNIQHVLWTFLWDTSFIAPVKKLKPDIFISSIVRWRDIYHDFTHMDETQKQQTFSYIDRFFVRDTRMRAYMEYVWFLKEKIKLFYTGKHISDYQFFEKSISPVNILVGGRFVEKKGILETLEFLDRLLKSGKIEIGNIHLVWRPELAIDTTYEEKIFQKIHSSPLLEKKIWYRGFLKKHEFRELIEYGINVFIWHFQVASDGDQDGIPNVMVENMFVWNVVFSTLAWGIEDILIHDETGYILSWDNTKDVDLFEKVLSDSKKISQVTHQARKKLETKCNIDIQIKKLYSDILWNT